MLAVRLPLRAEKGGEKTMKQTQCVLSITVAILFVILALCANLQKSVYAQANSNTISFDNQSS